MSKHFIVYRTDNLLTKEFYIGVHGQEKDDTYLGSGVKIKAQIKKFGRQNFVRTTLFSFASKELAFAKEIELLVEHLGNPLNLNVGPGGEAAWHRLGEVHRPESKEMIAKSVKAFIAKGRQDGTYVSVWNKMPEATKEKLTEILKSHHFTSESGARAGLKNAGKKKSKEHNAKVAASVSKAAKNLIKCPDCGRICKGKSALGAHNRKHK